MIQREQPQDGDLEQIVALAMNDLTLWVYRKRDVLRIRRRDGSLTDPSARAAAIHTFQHLKHGGYSYVPEDIRTWAISHGWKAVDAEQLAAYAAGVKTGVRYHTVGDPLGPLWRREWYESAVR